MTYQKKPVVVEAMKYDGDYEALFAWANSFPTPHESISRNAGLSAYLEAQIYTLEGNMRINRGDWLVRGVAGEFYPVRPDIFEQTYEAVNPPGYPKITRDR